MFEKITEDVENISKLPDSPSMATDKLKQEFDKASKTIKDAFNRQADKLTELEKDILRKSEVNVISARCSRKSINIPTAWGGNTVTFDTSIAVGDKLTLEKEKIKIGKNVKKIIVSATCEGISHSVVGDKVLNIKKNNINIAGAYTAGLNNNSFVPATISDYMIDVAEGDILTTAIVSRK